MEVILRMTEEMKQGERKSVRGKGNQRGVNKDPNLSAGKRSDNALEHRPRKKRKPDEPVVIEKTA
jgi:hypothetical protein